MSPSVLIEGYPAFVARTGQSLLEACEDAGVPMESACGGFAACNSCRVQVIAGAEHLDPVDDEEECFLDAPGQRLGCQIVVRADLRARLDPGC